MMPDAEQSKVASVTRSRMESMMRLKTAPSWKVASNMADAGKGAESSWYRHTVKAAHGWGRAGRLAR